MLKLLIAGLTFVGAGVLLLQYTDLRGNALVITAGIASLLVFSIKD